MDREKKKNEGPTISIIAVMGKNLAIGKDNSLLWRLPKDLERFKKITSNHPVIMGRKTYESIGHPLADRLNIVLSRKPHLKIEGCFVFASLKKALKFAKEKEKDEIFIIGGESIFIESFPVAEKMYLTIIDDSPQADSFFPEYENNFEVINEKLGEENNYKYKFTELLKKK